MVVSMEYKFIALQTIHKCETMKKSDKLEVVMLLLVAGKEKKRDWNVFCQSFK